MSTRNLQNDSCIYNTIEAKIMDRPSPSGAIQLEHDQNVIQGRRLKKALGNGKTGLVSAIIATRNRPDYLARVLHSLRKQTYGRIEIVVVDDGSDIDVLGIAKRYAVNKVVRTRHIGAAGARNEGFLRSEGGFVIICDDDLILEPTMIEKLLDALSRNPSKAYAYCGFLQQEKDGCLREMGMAEFDPERLIDANYFGMASLVRRSKFLEAGMFDPSLRRLIDWDLWLSLLEKGEDGVLVPEILFTHLRTEGPRITDGENPVSLPAGIAREIVALKHPYLYPGLRRHRSMITFSRFIQYSDMIGRAIPDSTRCGEFRMIIAKSLEIAFSRGIRGLLRMASEKIKRHELKILD